MRSGIVVDFSTIFEPFNVWSDEMPLLQVAARHWVEDLPPCPWFFRVNGVEVKSFKKGRFT